MPDKNFLRILRAVLRNRIYRDGRTGGCHLVSRWLEWHYGYEFVSGCFVTDRGGHADHCWNILPDGRILDATADQFSWWMLRQQGGRHGIFIGKGNRRYIKDCPCNAENQKWLRKASARMYTLRMSAEELGIR